MVESPPVQVTVANSSPVDPGFISIAQWIERNSPKVEVAGSIPARDTIAIISWNIYMIMLLSILTR